MASSRHSDLAAKRHAAVARLHGGTGRHPPARGRPRRSSKHSVAAPAHLAKGALSLYTALERDRRIAADAKALASLPKREGSPSPSRRHAASIQNVQKSTCTTPCSCTDTMQHRIPDGAADTNETTRPRHGHCALRANRADAHCRAVRARGFRVAAVIARRRAQGVCYPPGAAGRNRPRSLQVTLCFHKSHYRIPGASPTTPRVWQPICCGGDRPATRRAGSERPAVLGQGSEPPGLPPNLAHPTAHDRPFGQPGKSNFLSVEGVVARHLLEAWQAVSTAE
jgi:hypothetical protein